ncbi:MAG: gamma-glutamyltransferase family protein [Firmicutes bacterium]|nr:gamma-glutamyltransferase family protein [Bacillota bacterium]
MVDFDYDSTYPSRRSPVMGCRGAVATSHPLAAQAGMNMLAAGGNAMDATLAMAAALVVLEPTSCGLGGDAFAIIWDEGKMHGLNASGKAPMSLSAERLRASGMTEMPREGWASVTTPGAVSAWSALYDRFGSMPFGDIMAPAIYYAREGAPVPPVIAGYWRNAERRYGGRGGVYAEFERVFLSGGRAIRSGEIFRNPDLAETLQSIAASYGRSFYQGSLARAIAEHSEASGGYLSMDDLLQHSPEWVEPVSTNYRGLDIWEIPPNGQGIVALMALNIMEGYDLEGTDLLSPDVLHVVIESLRLAFVDAHAYIGDPLHVDVPTRELLSKEYGARRRRLIQSDRALAHPVPGKPGGGGQWESSHGDTVYLCAADSGGMMVSYIQSNYMGFGSGIVIPGTGISMQNRGAGFSLHPGHPNELAPGKRPFHTIIPSFATRNGVPIAAFGVMGGDMQPQGHVQVVSGIIDGKLDPQAAIDRPRVRVMADGGVAAEPGISDEALDALHRMGHVVRLEKNPAGFGGGQMIWRDPGTGVLIAGSEPRKDGCAIAL